VKKRALYRYWFIALFLPAFFVRTPAEGGILESFTTPSGQANADVSGATAHPPMPSPEALAATTMPPNPTSSAPSPQATSLSPPAEPTVGSGSKNIDTKRPSSLSDREFAILSAAVGLLIDAALTVFVLDLLLDRRERRKETPLRSLVIKALLVEVDSLLYYFADESTDPQEATIGSMKVVFLTPLALVERLSREPAPLPTHLSKENARLIVGRLSRSFDLAATGAFRLFRGQVFQRYIEAAVVLRNASTNLDLLEFDTSSDNEDFQKAVVAVSRFMLSALQRKNT
jgi:hypothetical protein